jgi:hypothetical protein
LVTSSQFCAISTITQPKPKVTIATCSGPSLSEGRPRSTPQAAAASPATGSAAQKENPSLIIRSAVTYAPTAAKPACPSETRPA